MTGVFPNFYMRILIYDYVDCEYRSSAIKLVFADFVTKLLGYVLIGVILILFLSIFLFQLQITRNLWKKIKHIFIQYLGGTIVLFLNINALIILFSCI